MLEAKIDQEQLKTRIKDQVLARLRNTWRKTLADPSELKQIFQKMADQNIDNNEQILKTITSMQPPIHDLVVRRGEEFPWIALAYEGVNPSRKGDSVDSLLKLCTQLVGDNDHLQDLARAAVQADEEKFQEQIIAAYRRSTESPSKPSSSKISIPIDEKTGLTADLTIGLSPNAKIDQPIYEVTYVDVFAPTHLEKDGKTVNTAAELVGAAVRQALI